MAIKELDSRFVPDAIDALRMLDSEITERGANAGIAVGRDEHDKPGWAVLLVFNPTPAEIKTLEAFVSMVGDARG